MVPFFSLVLNLSMFSVAVPAIRTDFGLAADTASWVVLAYTIPYVVFMPFYGRLGDLLGPRRLVFVGIFVYAAGTIVCMAAPGLRLLVAGRIVQGAGGAGVNPLSLAIISREVAVEDRGRAMGTWNAAGPFTGIVGPVIAGLLVDAYSWRAIFLPMLVAQAVAVLALLVFVPADPDLRTDRRDVRGFDWAGMALTGAALLSFVLFLSSRPVTGRAPFTDWRFGVLFAGFALGWYFWERRQEVPFVAMDLFARPQFAIASVSVSARMILLGGMSFLVPLYATDVLAIPASQTGLVITGHAAALLLTMRFGGRLADVWNRRWAVVIGLGGQTAMMATIALLPGSSIMALVIPMVVHGAFAGLSLASLHHVALHEIPEENRGVGAGTYSMSRFVGSLLGASVMGVVLEGGLASAVSVHAAYQRSFLIAALLGIIGIIPAFAIRRHGTAQTQ
jgi:MFS family permease